MTPTHGAGDDKAIVHKPVLLKEILEIFSPKEGETYIDATVNGGGHTMAILERVGPTGKVFGVDWDCNLIKDIKVKIRPLGEFTGFARRKQSNLLSTQRSNVKGLTLVCNNYANLRDIARKFNLEQVSGVLFDCGFSSYHVEKSGRGFSFMKNEPLDMRYHYVNRLDESLTAEIIVNTYGEKKLADIFWNYGGERFSKKIAKKIVEERRRQPVKTTVELARIIGKVIYFNSRYQRSRRIRIHPATRVFQALRIAVNDELGNLAKGLDAAVPLLRTGGKLIIISFHSLEDRIVKNFFKAEEAAGRLAVITAKPMRSSVAEVRENPRSRSAKLRAAQKI